MKDSCRYGLRRKRSKHLKGSPGAEGRDSKDADASKDDDSLPNSNKHRRSNNSDSVPLLHLR